MRCARRRVCRRGSRRELGAQRLGERCGQARGTRRQQARQVQRSTRLGAGTRQALATKGLHADHRADHVAVHIDIADVGLIDHIRDRFIDAGVNAQCQAVAGPLDRFEQTIDLPALEAHDVKHRSEHFAFELSERVDLDQRGRYEGAQTGGVPGGKLMHAVALATH